MSLAWQEIDIRCACRAKTCGVGRLSARLEAILEALPLEPGMRVLEIGCGPGVLAREVARRVSAEVGSRGACGAAPATAAEHIHGHVLAIDRSARAIAQARSGCASELESGRLSLRCVAIEDFVLGAGDERFDLAFAIRVGALDGRHPELYQRACARIAAALKPRGKLLIDGGKPLRELRVDSSAISRLS